MHYHRKQSHQFSAMCRWGKCPDINTVYMCKFCGTRYCHSCLRGDFPGKMYYPDLCRICKQPYCRGRLVEADMPKNAKKSFSSTALSPPTSRTDDPQSISFESTNKVRAGSRGKSKIFHLIPPQIMEDFNRKPDLSYP